MMPAMTELEKLLRRIDRYRARHGMAATTFGMKAKAGPNLLKRLQDGNVTLKTIRKVTAFLEKQTA